MRHPILSSACSSACLLVLASLSAPAARAADLVDPGANYQELRDAAELVRQGQARQAIDRVQLLDQISGGRCGECQVVLAQAYLAVGDRAQAATAARSALAQLSDLGKQASASATLAYSLVDPQNLPGSDLAGAESAVRQAIDQGTDPQLRSWGFKTLAWILIRREHYGDAVAEARDYLDDNPGGAHAGYAQRVLCAGRALGAIGGPDDGAAPAPPRTVAAPKPVFAPKPTYTARARQDGLHGQVIVQGVVDTEGCLTQPAVVHGLDADFDQHVLDTVQLWTFQPATRASGEPVPAAYSAKLSY
jgi:TonB family protein